MCACNSRPSPSEKEIEKEISHIYLATATFEDIIGGTLGDLKDVDVKNVYVSQSAILDTMNINFSRNNIATITYENLSPEERESYDYIGVDISQKNGEEVSFSFTISTLEQINTAKKTAYQFAESINNKSYQNLKSIVRTGPSGKEPATLLEDYFTKISASAGTITNYYFYGIGEGEHLSKTYYSFLGTFVYVNGMTQNFHVNVFVRSTVVEGYDINPIKS